MLQEDSEPIRMPEESKDTLTLESLLGAYSGSVSHASGHAKEEASEPSDLLSDLLGVSSSDPARTPVALDLDHLPTLPRIPGSGAAPVAPADGECETNALKSEESEETPAKPSEPAQSRVEEAPAGKVRRAIGRRKKLRSAPASQPAPQPDPRPASTPKPEPCPASTSKPESRPVMGLQPASRPAPVPQLAPTPLSASRRGRKTAAQPAIQSAIQPAAQPAIQPAIQPATPTALPQPAPRPTASPATSDELPSAPPSASSSQPPRASAPRPRPVTVMLPASTSSSDADNATAPSLPSQAEKRVRRGRHAVAGAAAQPQPRPAARTGRGKHADKPAGNPDADELRALRRKLLAKMEALEETGAIGAQPDEEDPSKQSSVAEPRPAQTADEDEVAQSHCIQMPVERFSFHRVGTFLQKLQGRSARIVAACTCAGVLCVASFALGSLLLPASSGNPDDAAPGLQNARPSQEASGSNAVAESDAARPVPSNDKDSRSDDASASQAGSGEDRSGTVVYRYVMRVGKDESRTVTETVKFNSEGLCETSIMEATFADGEAAAAFLDTLSRSYASAYVDGTVDGATAVSTIDVSANELDREAYEDTLRTSVTDLSIVKKS